MTPIHIIDAFASRPFTGNPAAVMPLSAYPDDALMQAIAAENNLSETAFIVPDGPDGPEGEVWHLRWFTPAVEVPLCGHATLASAWVIFNRLAPELQSITFQTLHSGRLTVRRNGERLVMDLPAHPPSGETKEDFTAILGVRPVKVFTGWRRNLALLETAAQVRALTPDIAAIAALGEEGLVVTAPGDQGYDCVSRYFAPGAGIPEDPVTGGAHCVLTPFWCERLGKTELRAYQASARGGELICRLKGDRVELEGQCAPYAQGMVEIAL